MRIVDFRRRGEEPAGGEGTGELVRLSLSDERNSKYLSKEDVLVA